MRFRGTKEEDLPAVMTILHQDVYKRQTYSYDDLMTYKSETALKEAGKLRLEGKDYIVQDGDVMHFRFNV